MAASNERTASSVRPSSAWMEPRLWWATAVPPWCRERR